MAWVAEGVSVGTRREQVLDAAVHLMVEDGTYGLTHRKVDARAGVPMGTTSNFFRTRLALTQAILRDIAVRDFEVDDWSVGQHHQEAGEDLLLAWLRRRAEVLLGPSRLRALAWYRFFIEGSAAPEVRAEIAAQQERILRDTTSIVVECGSTDPSRHAAVLRTFVGALVLFHNSRPISELDQVLVPMARGLMHVIRRDAQRDTQRDTQREVGVGDGSA